MANITLLYSLFLSLIFSLCNIETQARVHDYETTRLKSTAGAGVGSLLANESALLNPASMAFFSSSSFYFQKEQFEYSEQSEKKQAASPIYSALSESRGIIFTDSRSPLRGALAHQKQQEGPFQRRRLSMALASVMNRDSALGLLFRKTTDIGPSLAKDKYYQLVIGSTRIIDEKFTVGAIIIDPLKVKPQDVRAIVGGQYVFKNILTFMFDIGGNYAQDLAESRLFRGAFQLGFLKDFFLRAGVFEDRSLDEKGNGFGVAWLGPKLVLEASVKKTKDLRLKENPVKNIPSEMTETSLAISYFF